MGMNARIKALWLATLTSGEYEQIEGGLKVQEEERAGFCCLGVLCDLHAKETGTLWNDHLYLGEESILPQTVQEWAGLENGNPSVTLTMPNDERGTAYDCHDGEEYITMFDNLAEANDGGFNFREIAAVIKEQL